MTVSGKASMNEALLGTPAIEAEELQQVEFLRQFAVDPALRTHPPSQARHAALTSRASVCSYCGVGCSYTVQIDDKGVDRLTPLSPLGLCVKGKTSLLTGGDAER